MVCADWLAAALKARGIEPLMDRGDICAFEDWWNRIEGADSASWYGRLCHQTGRRLVGRLPPGGRQKGLAVRLGRPCNFPAPIMLGYSRNVDIWRAP